MKKLCALLLAVLMIFALVACSNNPNDNNTTNTPNSDNNSGSQPELKDPQKEEALSEQELRDIITNTGNINTYNAVYTFSSDVESTLMVIVHDGNDVFVCNTIKNAVSADGSLSLVEMKEEKYVFSESKKYINEDEEWKGEDYTFNLTADKVTYATLIDILTVQGFFNAILNNVDAAEYNIILGCYSLPDIHLVNGDTTLMFENVYLTFEDGYLFSIVCNNGTQTLSFELMNANT